MMIIIVIIIINNLIAIQVELECGIRADGWRYLKNVFQVRIETLRERPFRSQKSGNELGAFAVERRC